MGAIKPGRDGLGSRSSLGAGTGGGGGGAGRGRGRWKERGERKEGIVGEKRGSAGRDLGGSPVLEITSKLS